MQGSIQREDICNMSKKTLFNVIKEMRAMKIMYKSKVSLYIVEVVKIIYKNIKHYLILRKKYVSNIWKKALSYVVEKMKVIQKGKDIYTMLQKKCQQCAKVRTIIWI